MTAERIHDLGRESRRSNWPRARVVQWAVTAVIVLIAEIVFFAGHTGESYVLDAIAVWVFFALRRRRENLT